MGHLMMQHLDFLTVQCLLLLILPNLGKNLVVSKLHLWVYLSELLKAYFEDTMLGTNEGCVECNSLGISEFPSEDIKEGSLLGLRDNINDGDKL